LIPFSTGIVLNGAAVVSAAPILMGFGSNTVETINGSGESTIPSEAGGFAWVVPAAGVISSLAISADVLVVSTTSINVIGLIYDFTVFRASSPTNSGNDQVATPYTTTALASSLTFGSSTITAGTYRSATNLNAGSLNVVAGDRIGVRVRTRAATDPSAADTTSLCFSASLTYTRS
jgi:hypothetical protein